MKQFTKKHLLFIYFALLSFVFIILEFNRSGDFYVYLEAAADIYSKQNIYSKLYGNSAMLFYFGNPFITFVFYPLSLIPITFAVTIWKITGIISLIRIIQLTDNFLFKSFLNRKENLWALLVLCLSSFYLVYSNLHLVQLTIVMLLFCLESLHRIFEQKQQITGGILLALAFCFKITPVVLVPYLIYKLKWRSLVAVIVIILFAILVPSSLIGWEHNISMWQDWLEALTPEKAEWAIFDMNNRKNHGISALLSTLFIADIEDNIVRYTHRRHLVDLGYESVKYLIYSARIFFILFTLYFLKVRSVTNTKLKLWWEWSYLLLIIPLFFPQQRLYNFMFLLPAISYLILTHIKQYQHTKKLSLANACFLLSILILNLELIFGVYRKLYWYHKSTTYATIVLLILLATQLPKPFKLVKKQ